MGIWINTAGSNNTGSSLILPVALPNNTGSSVIVPIALPNNTGSSVIVPIALVVAVIVPIAPILFSIARFGRGSQQGER